jgi:hypothetical protein
MLNLNLHELKLFFLLRGIEVEFKLACLWSDILHVNISFHFFQIFS